MIDVLNERIQHEQRHQTNEEDTSSYVQELTAR